MTVTLAAVYEQLRISTSKMLGYDYANLTAAQSVRLDRAALLRLELDDCQTKKLAGQPVDTSKYVVASEALERLMGGDPEASAVNHEPDFAGAWEKLSALLTTRRDNLKQRDVTLAAIRSDEIIALKAALADKEALIEQLRAGTPQAATQSTPPPPPPSPTSNASPPAHYLRGTPEPWRDNVIGRDRWSNRG